MNWDKFVAASTIALGLSPDAGARMPQSSQTIAPAARRATSEPARRLRPAGEAGGLAEDYGSG